jgi:hypothetical protein
LLFREFSNPPEPRLFAGAYHPVLADPEKMIDTFVEDFSLEQAQLCKYLPAKPEASNSSIVIRPLASLAAHKSEGHGGLLQTSNSY